MELTLTLGILLAAGFAADLVSSVIRLPRVTLYIVAGLLLGPSVFAWVPGEHIEELDPVLKLALALVLMDMGSRFPLAALRSTLRRVWPLSAGELIGTMVFVTTGLALLGESFGGAVLLGSLALATAPATTVLVLREYHSEGRVTSSAYALVALNNLAAIVLFEVLFVLVLSVRGAETVDPGGRLLWLVVDLGGSTVIGFVGGLLASAAAGQLAAGQRHLATMALIVVVLGLCESLNMPYLLAFLMLGITLASTSELAREIVDHLDSVGTFLYIIFFVAAGAHLDIRALGAAGTIGAGYVVLRSLGKYSGTYAAARLRRETPALRRWLGCTLLAQAGAAIGLVRVAAERAPELGGHLANIIIGTVVFFEILGPILTGLAVIHSGEVPLIRVIQPYRPGWRMALRMLLNRLRSSFGREPIQTRTADGLTVGELMRRDVQALSQADHLLQILDFIEHSPHHTYPVVDETGRLLGVIRYRSIRSALFDPQVSNLVVAQDLLEPASHTVQPDQSLEEALKLFEESLDDVLPVVASAENVELVGLIERRDVVRVIKSQRSTSPANP